ncbi:phage tail tape measure protein [Bacillus paralicheniformis]|nr:phage tail tape measure protein [Bacillus paralicheniformis]
MATLSEIMVRLSLDMKDFNQKMDSVGSKTKKIGSNMQSMGKTLTKNVSVPLGLIGGAVIKMGSDFEATMSKVKAITGANGLEMDKLSSKAKDLGATTKFSASEVAEGMTYLGMAGMNTDEILSSMGGMLDLAAAGALDLASASDIATNIMSGFGMSADQSGRMADVLAYAASNANTNVSELGEAMKPLAPMASSLGWSLEDSTSAVMALADAGIKGEMAGSAFATSLGRLTKPTREMRNTMKELGLEFFDAEGNMKSMPEVIAELERGTAGMTKEQKAATLTTLFGAEAYKHWSTLLSKGSDELGKNSKALENADGTAKKMADTMSDNLQGKTKELMSA